MNDRQSPWHEVVERSRAGGALAKTFYVIHSSPIGDLAAIRDCLPDHLAYQEDLEARGISLAAGPVSDDDSQWQGEGMIVVRAASMAEAQAIAEADPMHKRGARRFVLRRWLINEGSLTLKISLSEGRCEVG